MEARHGRVRTRVVRVAAVLTIATGLGAAWAGRPTDERPRFCTADGYVLGDGRILSRDPDRDCRWVDEEGRLVRTDGAGTPLPGTTPPR